MMEQAMVLTVNETAEQLRVNPRTIYRRLREGTMPGIKIGHQWRIARQELDAYLRGEWQPPAQNGS